MYVLYRLAANVKINITDSRKLLILLDLSLNFRDARETTRLQSRRKFEIEFDLN